MTIFHETSDFLFYLKLILMCQMEYGFEIYAICLMRNHFHMIIKDAGMQLSLIMDTINSTYARYYNKKYKHKGTVFDGPYKSNRVLSDYGFLKLFRYIIRNPVVAGIVNSIFDYPWVTTTEEKDQFNLVNFDYVNEIFSRICKVSYFEFLESNEDDLWLDEIEIHRIEDCDAERIFNRVVYHLTYMTEFNVKKINKNKQISIIKTTNNLGVTIRQLSNLSGFSMGKIHSMIHK